MTKRCSKGKSCGATCITRPDRCVLELGPVISKSLTQARSKIGVVQLYYKVRDQKIKGGQAKFERIRKDLAGAIGGRINRTSDLIELKNQLQKEGLIPKSKKSEEPEGLGAIFAKQVAAGAKAKKDREVKAASLPSDLKGQLWALPEPKEKTTAPGTPAKSAKKGSTDLVMDDISRILRGSLPQHLEVASAGGETGMKARAKVSGTQAGSATGNTRWARDDAGDFDKSFKIYKRIRGDKEKIDWDETVKGGKKIGEGSFGTVLKVGNVAHKRGEVSAEEANILKRVGEAGIGPKLHGAEISTKVRNDYGVEIHNGRIAMSIVPGKPLGEVQADKKFGGKNAADVYWKAMADLHRLGIAHNDAHIENILVDKSGNGKWVDLGLAQASPKAALAEAMGIFNTIPGAQANRVMGARGDGNWQTRRYAATGVAQAMRARAAGGDKWKDFMDRFPVASKVWENRGDAQFKLLKMGLTKADVSSIIDHGIRSPMETYTKGAWSKLTDKQAQEVLNILYDGI